MREVEDLFGKKEIPESGIRIPGYGSGQREADYLLWTEQRMQSVGLRGNPAELSGVPPIF